MNMHDCPTLGLHLSMPPDTYHAVQAMSATGLKRMRQSPAHFYGMQLDPERPPNSTTPAMRAGTLAHTVLLEPQTVSDRYVMQPTGHDGRTKEGKAWAAAVPTGIETVSATDMQIAQRQAIAVRALPEVGVLLASGVAESSAFWIDDTTVELCKCRPDWVHTVGEGVILVDLKTCQDASPEGFPRSIAKLGYHLQAAWYSAGYEFATGKRVLGFVFACVEAAWPHAAAAYMLDDESLDKARFENRRLLDLYAACKASGHWPGYQSSIQPLSLPAWAV